MHEVALSDVSEEQQVAVYTYIVMAYIVMAYKVMAYTAMAYIIMGYLVMAYIVGCQRGAANFIVHI